MEHNNKQTKHCPYCGEEIMASAKKCRYCGEWLDKEAQPITKQVEKTNGLPKDKSSEPSKVPAMVIMGVATFIAVFLIAFYRTTGLNLSGHGRTNIGSTVDTALVDTTDYDESDTYDSSDYENTYDDSDDDYTESDYGQSDDYYETGMRCKGEFTSGGTPIELIFSIDQDGNINDGTVKARLTNQEFNDLAGHLSGQHLEMTFANGGSQVSLDIVSGNKMTGTIEGDEVILHFTTQHS